MNKRNNLVHVDALPLEGLSQLLRRQLHGHPEILRVSDPVIVLPDQDVLKTVDLHLPLLVLGLQTVEHFSESVALD
jgi:hypothetical protein